MVFIVHPIEPKAFSPRVQGYEPDPRRDDAVQGRLAEVAGSVTGRVSPGAPGA